MTYAIRNPHDCGNSINYNDIFICRMSSTLCATQFGNECELDKIDSFVDALAKSIWRDKTE